MTDSASEHYKKLLGRIYPWMVGDFDTACKGATSYFESIGLMSEDSGVAVDLGCGHGVQSIPLCNLGFHVVAVDSSEELLSELRAKQHGGTLETVCGDLVDFVERLQKPVNAFVCMGDTLTHLATVQDVERTVQSCARNLLPGGVLCLSFRDYTSRALRGVDRFIPVRTDENRIQMCFIETHAEYVLVHDVLHERVANDWQTTVGAYRKLRLSPAEVTALAVSTGVELLAHSEHRGMTFLTFAKPAASSG
ncbi:MAG: methyltransferase domain-containing protein [Planctomycetota bacterium]